jgi:O-6-methylguanine DNA methyltransferase
MRLTQQMGVFRQPQKEFKMETFYVTQYQSPFGTYFLGSSKVGVVLVKTQKRAGKYLGRWDHEQIELKQLDDYFNGKLRQFNIPLDLRGTTFQRQVWNLLCDIPWGETRSYGHIAKALGRPKAARAVGRAVGTNPVSIVVPCHRIIGSNGALTGYGGGLDRKEALLKLEAS